MFTDDRTALITSRAMYHIQIIYINCVNVVVTKDTLLLSFFLFYSLISYSFLETSAIDLKL